MRNQRKSRLAKLVLLLLMLLGFAGLAPYRLGLVALATLFGLHLLEREGLTVGWILGSLPPSGAWVSVLKYLPLLLVASFGLGQLTLIVLSHIAPEATIAVISGMAREAQNPLFLLLAVVVAPVLEELLFRGMLFPLLSRYWGVTGGLIASAVIFGLLHLNILGATLFGVLAAVLYVRYSSLYIPIGLHLANNLVPTLILWLAPVPEAEIGLQELREGLWSGLLLTLAGGVPILRFIRRNWPRVPPLQLPGESAARPADKRIAS